MVKKIYLLVICLVVCGLAVKAQNNTGSIKVILKDKGNNELIPFANVVAYQNGVQVGVGTTNMDGECVIKPLAPGKYDVKGVYVGYQASETKGVIVGEGKTAYVTIALSNGEGVKLDEVEVVTYQQPLIDPDMKSGGTVTREDYQNMATKNINSVAATTAGVFSSDEGSALNIRGGRTNQTTYFVDGIKVIGGLNMPQQSIEQLNVITGGLPAMYGDATAGVISITTRGPSSKFFGGVELISSQLTDPYGYNSLGFSVGGPIISKRDSNGVKTPLMGFFLSGQGNYMKDPSPSATPIYALSDQAAKNISAAPLIPSRSGFGFTRALEYTTTSDYQVLKSHQNIANRQLALNGKIDIRATANTNVTLGGALDYNKGNPFDYGNSLFNANQNGSQTNTTWRTYLRVTQKFGNKGSNAEKEKSQSIIKNPFFSFLSSFESTNTRNESALHGSNYFDYGYIGKFTPQFSGKNNIYNYTFNPKMLIGNDTVKAWEYQGQTNIGTSFTPGTANPDPTRYTTYLQTLLGGQLPAMDFIPQLNGLRNGDVQQGINNLWNAFGTSYNSYNNSGLTQFRIASSFNADIKSHALTLGVEYDQREYSGYFLAPTALWTRMRLLVNEHTSQLDKSNPILVPELSGTYPAYFYNQKYDAAQQSEFSIKLLQKLGMPVNNTSFVNIDGMDPSTFNINMFSAEDLLGQNSGNQLVDYYGYDYKGNRTTGATNLDDFLNKTDEYGKHMFPVGSFRPIYMAGYIQDKFDFKDIKFNVGLRVDRYDANQKVLKDKYSVYEIKTVGQTSTEFSHPSNMGADYAVYTTALSGGSVVGYRNGDQWYDAKGNEVTDPTTLIGSTGKLNPYLADNSLKSFNSGVPFVSQAFQNYIAQINVMPRVAFSFPISDVANFFAHYDVLTKRPPGLTNRFDPKDYYFLQSESSTPIIANPNLIPERTVDYELGFNQILNERKNAALKITAFYKELRNNLTLKQIVAAFPRSYITYVNQDFGTVKGMSFEFDLRRSGGSRINANYTLQFAEGSGSNANSGANLAASGQPNLRVTMPLDYDQRHSFVLTYDFRFGAGKDYKGPEVKKKNGNAIQLFKDIGFNLQFLVGSGTPYTRWVQPVAINGGNRSQIAGSLNGSYKPWTFRTNLRIDKNIQLTWGKKDSENRKKANLNIYLQILNLLNTKNVLNVYNFTGNPNDDGYLSSTYAQAALAQANSAQGYISQYSIYMNSPFNYSLPRQFRIGLMLDF